MDPEKILQTDYLDLIFKGRNKNYGSYALRKRYIKRMLTAGGITLGTLALVCGANMISLQATETSGEMLPPPIVIRDLSTISKPPPPPPKIESAKHNGVAAPTKPSKKLTTLKVLPNEKVPPSQRPDPPKPKENIAAAAHKNDGPDKPDAKDPGLSRGGKDKSKLLGDDDSSPEAGGRKDIMAIQQLASYPGGMAALYKFIKDNLRYPSGAMEQNIQGKVVVEFVVAANGQVSAITVVRDLGYGTAAEAIRILGNMPKWNPAKQNGRPIPSYFTLPITFKLQ